MTRAGSRAYLLALFLVVVGARLWLVYTYSSSLPYWDQWDAEGWLLLKPWQEGHLHLADLFGPHNEHRLFLTRAMALGLYALSGVWNPFLEMTLNAILMGVFAVAISAVLLRLLGAGYRALIFIAVGLCFLPPFGWENTLCGFQSCLYFLSEFSFLALWGMGLHRPGSRCWWVGLFGAVLACFSMGSGFVAAGCVLGITLVRGWKLRRWSQWESAICVLYLVIVLLGWLTRTVAPVNAPLRVGSTEELVGALGRYFAWPLAYPWMALWMILPVALLSCLYLLRRGRSRLMEMLLMTGGWWMLQVCAVAYARGGHYAPPPSRYTDLLALGVVTSFFSLLVLLKETRRLSQTARNVLLGAWACPVLFGLGWETVGDFQTELPQHRQWLEVQTANIQGYLTTGDEQRYLAHKAIHDLPYPYVDELQVMLGDTTMRSLLNSYPLSCRWIESLLSRSPAIFLGGGLLFIVTWLRSRRARDIGP